MQRPITRRKKAQIIIIIIIIIIITNTLFEIGKIYIAVQKIYSIIRPYYFSFIEVKHEIKPISMIKRFNVFYEFYAWFSLGQKIPEPNFVQIFLTGT